MNGNYLHRRLWALFQGITSLKRPEVMLRQTWLFIGNFRAALFIMYCSQERFAVWSDPKIRYCWFSVTRLISQIPFLFLVALKSKGLYSTCFLVGIRKWRCVAWPCWCLWFSAGRLVYHLVDQHRWNVTSTPPKQIHYSLSGGEWTLFFCGVSSSTSFICAPRIPVFWYLEFGLLVVDTEVSAAFSTSRPPPVCQMWAQHVVSQKRLQCLLVPLADPSLLCPIEIAVVGVNVEGCSRHFRDCACRAIFGYQSNVNTSLGWGGEY